MRIGELSRRTGCKVETIRYYERIGLLPEPPRQGRYRSYGSGDAERLRYIRRARELNFSLEDARALIALAHSPGEGCPDVENLAREHLAEVRARIADLQSIERSLTHAVKSCGSNVDRCAVIEEVSFGRSVSVDEIRVW